jgi:hypothetical protein
VGAHNGPMVDKSPHVSSRAHGAYAPFPGQPRGAVYAITALRYSGSGITDAMMGLVDPQLEHWDAPPAPTRLVDVVDLLVEGDTVITLFQDEQGQLRVGPQVKVDVLPEGTETLSLADEKPGRRLTDLPRF